ncbi:MAG: hypothetical protein DBO99_14080 [gamma proteobacterium symbiont of Ctena orbiculata]|nr:MAG: hypothetical protein DBO99_14080 [gamma proteobacterium symbiont of Ctena orbiculata]
MVGIIGSFASIISLVLAIYFYTESVEIRDLTYHVHPARTAIVGANDATSISVSYKGKEIQSELSAASVAFWNAGEKEIRKEDILSPFVIEIEGKSPILEAKLLKKSRDPIIIDIDDSRKDVGLLEISWNVLEEHDGAVIQMIYASGTKNKITVRATLVGQADISSLKYPGKIRTPSEQYDAYKSQQKLTGFMMLGFGSIMLAVMVWFMWSKVKILEDEWREHIGWRELLMLSQPILFIGMAFYELVIKSVPFPPFGF